MKLRLLVLPALFLLAMQLVACGKGNKQDNDTAAVNAAFAGSSSVNGGCSAGYVYAYNYGCLPQGTCPYGYGQLNNNQCVVASSNSYNSGYASCQGTCPAGFVQTTYYGCLPQNLCGTCYGYYRGYCYPAY